MARKKPKNARPGTAIAFGEGGASPIQKSLAARAASKAGQLYSHLPAVPFLDRQTSAILYACIALYISSIAYFAISENTGGEFYLNEALLQKNAGISFRPGETYTYLLRHNGQEMHATYAIQTMAGCRGLAIYEPGEEALYCVSASGTLADDPLQRNSSLGGQMVLLFSPWMLAASQNFIWKVEGGYAGQYLRMASNATYTSLGMRKVLGRDAFLIIESSELSGTPTYHYVDSQKRILLYAYSGNDSVTLVSAPFALNLSDMPQN